MINLELPKRIEDTRLLLRQFSRDGLRPLSRKYDLAEQKEMPQELYELSKLLRARPNRGGGGARDADGGEELGVLGDEKPSGVRCGVVGTEESGRSW